MALHLSQVSRLRGWGPYLRSLRIQPRSSPVQPPAKPPENEPDAQGYEWTIAVSFQLADFAPLHWLRLGELHELSAPCPPAPAPAPTPPPTGPGRWEVWGHPLGVSHFRVWAPGSRRGARSLPASSLGAQAGAATFVPGKSGAASRGDTRCSRQRSRSPLAGRSGRDPQRRVGAGAGWGGGPGLGPFRPPGWRAGRRTRRTAGPGRLSFGKTLAVPPLVSVDPAAAFSGAADLCPPVAPAAPGQKGSPFSRTEPRAPWSRQAPESRGRGPSRGHSGTFSRPPRVPARPGTGWETEAGRGRSPARNRVQFSHAQYLHTVCNPSPEASSSCEIETGPIKQQLPVPPPPAPGNRHSASFSMDVTILGTSCK
ncbi:transcription initiation factor TFIID subunit 4-like [Pongo pygmaeus]|uniref:transcription initiation factor TFIID subunit 4-like n=1 Tax=Pongo pygmaeus TaxID=9600 RepID=UPI00300D5BA1